MNFTIRRLTEDDAADYRAIRLEGLKDSPKSFGDTYEEAKGRPAHVWTRIFDGDRAYFGAFIDEKRAGIINFLPGLGKASAHRGMLLGMYVIPQARRTGCALALVQAVLDHAAATGGKQVHLGVGTHNTAAQRLYEKAGFVRYGTEPRGLVVNGENIDEHLMIRFLDGYDWQP